MMFIFGSACSASESLHELEPETALGVGADLVMHTGVQLDSVGQNVSNTRKLSLFQRLVAFGGYHEQKSTDD